MITKLYYSIRNNGDGSASVIFMESKKLAELDQAYVEEGWGEDCSSYIAIESVEPIKVDEVITIDDMIKEVKEDMEYSPGANNREKLRHLEGLKRGKE